MTIHIHADFPGGNILVESIEGKVIHLKPDLCTTTTPWFYWYFAVTGAEGHRYSFCFDAENIGVRGPAVSLDGGRTWAWLGASSVADGAFEYLFPLEDREVRFSVGMPYVRADFDRFLSFHPELAIDSLATTASHRDVPYLLAGNADAPLCIVLTARHHACEMMGSYTLEGMIEAISGDAAWLREHCAFFIVPFMDVDGVEQGDQGKNRAPHDHNRDYVECPLYPEVRALKAKLPAWLNDRSFVFIDLHNPALSGPVHESIFFVEPENRLLASRLDELIDCFVTENRGPILVEKPLKLRFGSGFNSTSILKKATATAWAERLPGCILSVSLEIAYANVSDTEVNAESARLLGRDLAEALGRWLKALELTEPV